MSDPTELFDMVYRALLGARQRVLVETPAAELVQESRGILADHVDIDFANKNGDDLPTIRTKAKTPHGTRIIAELEASGIDLPQPPTRH